jgi:hypothetical protein
VLQCCHVELDRRRGVIDFHQGRREARAPGRAVVPHALPHRNVHHVRLLWDIACSGVGRPTAVVVQGDKGALLALLDAMIRRL